MKIEAWFARLEQVGIKTGMVPGCRERWGYGLILPDGGEVWLSDGGVPDGDISLDREEVSPDMWALIIEASTGFEGAYIGEYGDLYILPDEVDWLDVVPLVPVEAP